jgi:hypothetical protein
MPRLLGDKCDYTENSTLLSLRKNVHTPTDIFLVEHLPFLYTPL